jgi:hypothetical protein
MFNNLNCTICFVCHTRTRYHKSKCQRGSNILLSSKDHISPILGTNNNNDDNNNNWLFHVLMWSCVHRLFCKLLTNCFHFTKTSFCSIILFSLSWYKYTIPQWFLYIMYHVTKIKKFHPAFSKLGHFAWSIATQSQLTTLWIVCVYTCYSPYILFCDILKWPSQKR